MFTKDKHRKIKTKELSKPRDLKKRIPNYVCGWQKRVFSLLSMIIDRKQVKNDTAVNYHKYLGIYFYVMFKSNIIDNNSKNLK